MLLIAHTVTGAVIGSLVQDPISSFFLGLLSHILLDSIPHWNYPVPRGKLTFKSFLGFWPDVTGSAVIIAAFCVGDPKHLVAIFAGVFGAVFPDIITITREYQATAMILKPFQRFHEGIQREIKFVPGVISQAVFIAVALFIYQHLK